MYPAVFTVWFYANRAAIAEKYCVNKSRPMLHCDGNCYLAKKIQAAEERQNREQQAGIKNVWVEVMPCLLQDSHAVLPVANHLHVQFSAGDESYVATPYLSGVFRPPGSIVA
jgi:hypothetical protein